MSSLLTHNIPQVIAPQHPSSDLPRELSERVGKPPLGVVVTAAAASGGARVFTVQVVNQKNQPCSGLFLLDIWVATSVAGAPGGTQTVSAWPLGTVLTTLEVNRRWEVVTEYSGKAAFSLAYSGSRVVHAAVKGVVGSSGLAAI